MEHKLQETNAYQNGFLTNFHFSTDLSLFLQILETILRKNRVREKINATGIRVTGGPPVVLLLRT